MILISAAGSPSAGEHADIGTVVLELVAGLGLGVVAPVLIHLLLRIPGLKAEPRLQPLGPLAVGVLLHAGAHLTGANAYLAAFAGGAVVARLNPRAQESSSELGEQLAELAKFAALLVFGALLTPSLFASIRVGGWVVAVLSLVLVLVRPASLVLSLLGSPLERKELFAPRRRRARWRPERQARPLGAANGQRWGLPVERNSCSETIRRPGAEEPPGSWSPVAGS